MTDNAKGVLLALLGAILFSSKAIFVKLSYQFEVDTLTVLMLRMGFALPIYGFISVRESRGFKPNSISVKDWFILVIIGLIGYYFASLLDFFGLNYVSAGLERLILFLYPTITLLLAALLFKRKITKNQVLAISVAYLGILIAFWNQLFVAVHPEFWWGVFLIFGSACTFSLYLVGSERIIPKFGVTRFTAYCMVISCSAVLVHYGVSATPDITSHSWQVYLLGLSIAVFNTVIPSFLISSAISKIGAAKTSALSSVGPVFVILAAAVFLAEPITIPKVIGALVVILGIYLVSKSKR